MRYTPQRHFAFALRRWLTWFHPPAVSRLALRAPFVLFRIGSFRLRA
jgi:hypothetical protein